MTATITTPIALLFALALMPPSAPAADAIFRCTGSDGQAVFQQQPCEQGSRAVTAAPTNTLADTAATTTSVDPCRALAEAVKQVGLGYQEGRTERELRQKMAGRYSAATVQQAFTAFQFGRSVPSPDLAVFSQLICETRMSLPAPQAWHLNKNAITIRLQGWQQNWQWPSSWRMVGVREQPGFQIELSYADVDAGQLRVGCRAHDSGTRLNGMGHQLLALWAERVQAGASQPAHSPNTHPSKFGNRETRDLDSKRELFTANLSQVDSKGELPLLASRTVPPTVSVALTPQRFCVAVRSGAAGTQDVAREARALVELLLTNKPSPFYLSP